MKLPSERVKTEKGLSALALLVMACYFAVFAVINFKCFARFCEQDMYADTLVAMMMWEQKSLFPLGYVFGNQLYVVATPVLSALFYGLTGSPNTAMALATTVMSALIMLSFFWLLRPVVKRGISLACAALMLVACAFGDKLVNQEMGQLLFVLCSYYACYLITLFVVLGDYTRSVTDPRLRPLPLVLSLLLCFATGMQSLRQTCIMVLPILAFEGLQLLLGFRAQGRAILHRRKLPLLRALAYAAANLAGLLFVKLFPVHQCTIFDSAPADFSQRLADIYVAFRDVAGFGWAGPEHPFFILLLAFQLALLFGAMVLQLRNIEYPPPQRPFRPVVAAAAQHRRRHRRRPGHFPSDSRGVSLYVLSAAGPVCGSGAGAGRTLPAVHGISGPVPAVPGQSILQLYSLRPQWPCAPGESPGADQRLGGGKRL